MADLNLFLRIIFPLLFVALSTGVGSTLSKDTLGISPHDAAYYKSKVIKCKDGSKTFTRDQLNDDYCDCPDGTDEPGTAACPEGRFFCSNAGHVPLSLFSSRVNDGVCDCCDGSDEYDGKTKCPNTCWEAGKVAREKLKKKIATFLDGVAIKKKEVEKAKQAIAKDEAELSNLKSEENILKGIVQNLKEHKERIDKAEEEERRKKEEEDREKEEEEKKLKDAMPKANDQDDTSIQSSKDESEGVTVDSHDNQIHQEVETNLDSRPGNKLKVGDDLELVSGKHETDGDVIGMASESEHVAEIADDAIGEVGIGDATGNNEVTFSEDARQGLDDSTNPEGLSKEELGRLVASRWTGENAQKKTNEEDNASEDDNHVEDPDANILKQEYDDSYNSDVDEDRYKYDDDIDDHSDDDFDDHSRHDGSYIPDEDDKDQSTDSISSRQSWLEKIQHTVQNALQTFNFFKTPVNVSDAARVRKEYQDSSSKLSKIQSRISRLTEKLKHDYGKEKEFYSFNDQCFEYKQNKYVYKVCPFKQASQVEGHSTTRLGEWDKFDDSYKVMLFSNGDRCWNGPDRSLKVKLRCGLKNELADVDEPSRCEYVALLSTPVVCGEERLKELQQKLEKLNSGQPLDHDEL